MREGNNDSGKTSDQGGINSIGRLVAARQKHVLAYFLKPAMIGDDTRNRAATEQTAIPKRTNTI